MLRELQERDVEKVQQQEREAMDYAR
jgi:hypothetical protein